MPRVVYASLSGTLTTTEYSEKKLGGGLVLWGSEGVLYAIVDVDGGGGRRQRGSFQGL